LHRSRPRGRRGLCRRWLRSRRADGFHAVEHRHPARHRHRIPAVLRRLRLCQRIGAGLRLLAADGACRHDQRPRQSRWRTGPCRGQGAGRRGPGRCAQCGRLLMAIPARYYDGLVSGAQDAELGYEQDEGGALVVLGPSGAELARWPARTLHLVPARRGEIRLGANGVADGARIVVRGDEHIGRIRATLPLLAQRQEQERGRQTRLMALSALALAAVIAAYIFGVPLIASRLVQLVPPGWEDGVGQTVASQIEASIGGEAGLPLCDADPESLANRAIARFAQAALADTNTPFIPDVRVVRSDVPNAFAVPG